MHSKAMSLYCQKTTVLSISEAPIVRAFSRMVSTLQQNMVRKFEVAYTIAKEGIAFRKMTTICDLIERQSINLGEGYKSNVACSTFVDFIAKELRLKISETLQSCNHLTLLSQDKTTKVTNRAKLKGYILRWRKSIILLGCAVFHDILKSPAILCKVLQDSELCQEMLKK